MVGLTLYQPWASLMVTPDPQRGDGKPPKEWETRSWYPRVLPGLVAIHDYGVETCCDLEPWWEVDHVIPVKDGGTDNPANLRLVCHDCHVAIGYEQRAARKGRESGQFALGDVA
jgi:hypothetical protein